MATGNDRLTNQRSNTYDQETDSGPPGAMEGTNPDVLARDSRWHGNQPAATAVQDKAQLDADLGIVKDQAAKSDIGGGEGDTVESTS